MISSDRDRLHADRLPPALPIRPFSGPVSGRIRMPGSKSITNRALILAALSKGRTIIQNALFSEDTRIMLDALRMLGFGMQVNESESTIEVEGEGGRIPSTGAKLEVGNSGTSARFLTAVCCLAHSGLFQIDGVEQMRQRPIGGLVAALRSAGAQIEVSVDGGIPIRINPRGLKGGSITVDATASSQLLSAVLMVAPLASCDLKIRLSDTRIRRTYVDMTIGMMRDFGMDEERLGVYDDSFTIKSGSGYSREDETYAVESDASAASYFLALPAVVGGHVEVEDLKLDGLQGDTAFAETIHRLGCDLHRTVSGIRISKAGDVSELSGVDQDFFHISDTFLTLAALAPLLGESTTITGIGRTRKQETDRVSAVATELRKLGQEVMESEDALTIHPRPLREAVVDTYHDHRIAMSFSILGCYDLHGNGQPWMTILNPSTCAKTFPSFYQVLENLRSIT